MKENRYDSEAFFEKYSRMERSVRGLAGAGEWHALRAMLPDFAGMRVLDLGCGFGWHCEYAAQQGAVRVTGVDISEKMLEEAGKRTKSAAVEYLCMPIEDFDCPPESYDVVISSLALHYVRSFRDVCGKVRRCLCPGGAFVFSVEHPVFTAQGAQEWCRDRDGEILHWPVDTYFSEGVRSAVFLGETVKKYHKTLTTYLNTLLQTGFEIREVVEPEPDATMLDEPGMRDELRRPMMLLVSARAMG